jgi:tetratricopeptide (TPR) repeat protein
MNDFSKRIPCSDESCIGIINEKGICNICGKPLKSVEEERDEKYFDYTERSNEPCKSCGKQAEPNYAFPLCPTCRELLSKRQLPKWVKFSFFLVILITLFATTKFPKSLVGGIAFERGHMAEESNDFYSAVENYSEALKHFPNSPLIIARLGIAQQKAGDIAASRKTLNKIVDQKLPKEIIREINETFRNQDQEIRSLQSMISKSKKELANIEGELKGLSDSLESLEAEIDKIEASLKEMERRALKGFKIDQNQYDILIAKHDNLTSLYNQKLEFGKSAYVKYENKFQETNALIDRYNALISKR